MANLQPQRFSYYNVSTWPIPWQSSGFSKNLGIIWTPISMFQVLSARYCYLMISARQERFWPTASCLCCEEIHQEIGAVLVWSGGVDRWLPDWQKFSWITNVSNMWQYNYNHLSHYQANVRILLDGPIAITVWKLDIPWSNIISGQQACGGAFWGPWLQLTLSTTPFESPLWTQVNLIAVAQWGKD